MTEDIKCQRCGKCCHLIIDSKLSNIPCKFLLSVGNNRFVCRIYNVENRIEKIIALGNKCQKRVDSHVNYPNCPYNKPEWGISINVGDEIENIKYKIAKK